MKLSGFLNKPRWQAKDAATRRLGVAEDDDADLLANLATIARQDTDAGVRMAALKRLADPGLSQRLARDDEDAGVRAEARKLWFDLIAGIHPGAPSPVECARLLRAQDDAALIEHVARSAPDSTLRAFALSQVTRTGFIVERAVSDPAPELRLAALERIDDETQLERLVERTRKTDKRISRAARDRVDALRVARGDTAVTTALARSLCERLEKLVREPQGPAAIEPIDRQWSAIATQVSESLQARYRAAHSLLVAARDGFARPTTERAPPAIDAAPETVDSPVTPVESEISARAPDQGADLAVLEDASADSVIVDPAAPPVIEHAREKDAVSAPSEIENPRKIREREQRDARLAAIESVLVEFENALEAGVVARAHAAQAELARLRKALRDSVPRPLLPRIAEVERRYAELSQWQHWSDNQRRRQLCEAIEQLAGSGLHPDAVATRVREAQAEFSRLDAAEGHASSGPAQGWARRFHAACRHALEPAKSYFKKRQELRKTHADTITAALEQARGIADDSTDWPLLAQTRQTVVAALRELDRVDPHDRKTFARDLKSALTAIDGRLAAHHADVESAKAALIGEAETLATAEATRGSAGAARQLQEKWRAIANGRRDRDQKQWKVFRRALDAVFAKLDAERALRTERDTETLARAAALCAEFEALVDASDAPSRADVARIEREWSTLNVRDESLAKRLRAAQARLHDAGSRRARNSQRAPYEAWLARYRLCRAAEMPAAAIDELRNAWDQAPSSTIAEAELAARFDAASSGASAIDANGGGEDHDAAQREILIRMEIFGGIESPREDHDMRRALQVERLSARMRGSSSMTPHQELADLLERWTALGAPVAPDLDTRLEKDLAIAIETLP